MRLTPALLLLCACGTKPVTPSDSGVGGAGSPTYYADGSRLQVLAFTMSDGARVAYGGFYDTVLKTPCGLYPMLDGGGGWTCVPLDPSVDAGSTPLVTGTLGP